MVTDGAIEGLYHACHTLLGPDDEFIVADPGWLWPRRFAASRQARVVGVADLRSRCRLPFCGRRNCARAVTERTRMIYLVDPNNPLGFRPDPRGDRRDRRHRAGGGRLSHSRLYLSALCRRTHSGGDALPPGDNHDLQFLEMAWTGGAQARSGRGGSRDDRASRRRTAKQSWFFLRRAARGSRRGAPCATRRNGSPQSRRSSAPIRFPSDGR